MKLISLWPTILPVIYDILHQAKLFIVGLQGDCWNAPYKKIPKQILAQCRGKNWKHMKSDKNVHDFLLTLITPPPSYHHISSSIKITVQFHARDVGLLVFNMDNRCFPSLGGTRRRCHRQWGRRCRWWWRQSCRGGGHAPPPHVPLTRCLWFSSLILFCPIWYANL